MKFVDVKNDVAFHKIFGNANKTITLISFLNAALQLEEGQRIVSVTIENPYLFPTVPSGKTSVIDVRATDQKERKFIVEMQVAEREGFDKRVQYYASSDYATQIERGDDYPKLRPTYFIAILNFYFTQNPNYYSVHQTTDVLTGENLLKDIKYYFIELEKFTKSIDELDSMIDKWTYFIKNAEDLTVIPANVEDEGLKTAYIDADKQTWSKAELNAYNDSFVREADVVQGQLFALKKGRAEGRAEGHAEGRAEGEDKKEREMVLKLHQKQKSAPEISELLEIPLDRVQQIITTYGAPLNG